MRYLAVISSAKLFVPLLLALLCNTNQKWIQRLSKAANTLIMMPKDPWLLFKFQIMDTSLLQIEKIARGKPFGGQKYTIGRRKYPKNNVKIKVVGLRIRFNLSRWIWPISGLDCIGILQVGEWQWQRHDIFVDERSPISHRRIAIGIVKGAGASADGVQARKGSKGQIYIFQICQS